MEGLNFWIKLLGLAIITVCFYIGYLLGRQNKNK